MLTPCSLTFQIGLRLGKKIPNKGLAGFHRYVPSCEFTNHNPIQKGLFCEKPQKCSLDTHIRLHIPNFTNLLITEQLDFYKFV